MYKVIKIINNKIKIKNNINSKFENKIKKSDSTFKLLFLFSIVLLIENKNNK